MNNRLRVSYVLIFSFLSLVCFISVAILFNTSRVVQWDQALISAIRLWEGPRLTQLMKFFTLIGSFEVLACLSLIILLYGCIWLRHRLEILLFVTILGGSVLLNLLLKLAFHRDRPSLHRLIEETGFSFPSGHSMQAFAFYAGLTFLFWRHMPNKYARASIGVLGALLTVCIGLSRIYLGVHYPSDVVGGFLASGSWFALCVWCFQWYQERQSRDTE